MTIVVVFNNKEHTEATVEFRPTWFARKVLRKRPWFGLIEREKRERVLYGSAEERWVWADTGRPVNGAVLDAIDVRPEEVWNFEKDNPPPELPLMKVVER